MFCSNLLRRENLRWRFSHRKVLLIWRTVFVFICCQAGYVVIWTVMTGTDLFNVACMSQFVAFKMHMVKRTRHNRTDTTESANRMSIINGFFYCSIFGY